ncbi:MAG: DUF3299 domain-containing protein [Methyloligellaceae bacterium]
MLRIVSSLVVLLLVFCAAGAATAAERLRWQDLAPRKTLVGNPFRSLPPPVQSAIRDMFWIRKSIESGRKPSELQEMERQARRQIEDAGGDYAAVVAKVDAVLKQANADKEALVQELDGRDVQIPGYALPLEFSGSKVTEFLLVPYVGACIHAPPPPANQIVHVRSGHGIEFKGLFAPVWVTGRISARPSSQELSFVDGTSDIRVGYGLKATKVQRYR